MTKKGDIYRVEKKAIVKLIDKLIGEVEQVYSIKKGLLGKDIKIKETREGKKISLGLTIKRGASIPLVVEKVQSKLKQELEKILGIPVKSINVTIRGIKFSS